MQTPTIREFLQDKVPLGQVTIQGWVRTHRQSKNVSFIELADGTAVKGIQLVIEPGLESYQPIAARISTGASLRVEGELTASPAKGQKYEVKVSKVTLLGEADPEQYPLQKKGHSLEYLRDILHLRPRTNTFGAVFRIRSAAAMAVHKFYQERGFVYLTSPIVTTSDCEGAGAMFRVTTLDLMNIPRAEGKIDWSQDFFGQEASLTVSGQLEGEIFATALNRIYTFGP